MTLNRLKPSRGAKKRRKIIGRGSGSGHGKTATRGHKGQKARSGGHRPAWFEGGQMPLQRRLPKTGFTNIFKQKTSIINLEDLNIFEADSLITAEILKKKGLIKKNYPLKILGRGELKKSLTVKVRLFSKSAKKKIEAVGGKVEIIV